MGRTDVTYMREAIREYSDNDILVDEYIRFFILKTVYNDYKDEKYSGPPVIDALWQKHMLDTDKYMDFSIKVCKHFMERSSETTDDERKQKYANILRAYRIIFDCKPNPDYWPIKV